MGTAGADDDALAAALRAGRRAFDAADYGEAARRFAEVVAVDGRCAVAWYALGNARWRRGDRTGAIEAYRRAVGEEPGRARAWQNLSTAHLSAKEWAAAAAAAAKAVELDPSRAKGWNNLAAARFAQGDTTGAETALRRAVESDPRFGVAWANLGRLLASTARGAAARDAYERAIALGEGDAEVRTGLARVLAGLGDRGRAESVLEEVVRIDATSSGAWTALGDLRRARRAFDGAVEAYEAAYAAAEDLPSDVRAGLAARRMNAGLELCFAATVAGDRAGLLRACELVRLARGDLHASGGAEGPEVRAAVARCTDAARGRAFAATSPEVVLAALGRAFDEPAPGPDRGPGGAS